MEGTKGRRVAESGIFKAFNEADCDALTVSCSVILSKTVSCRALECMKGQRSRFPLVFAGLYPGEAKRKIGLSVLLQRVKGTNFWLHLNWFITEAEPPPGLGKVTDLFGVLAPAFGTREADITANFSYNKERVGSLFRPIQLAEGSRIFDEIVGFSGTKRDPAGKLLYTLDVELAQERLVHIVRFRQAVKLDEGLPMSLIPNAKGVSVLALERKVGT